MSLKTTIEKTRRLRTPVLPISAVMAYTLVGVERLFALHVWTSWPSRLDPMAYNAILDLWWRGQVFPWSLPEMFLGIHLLVVVFLWCSWRGWLADHPRAARSARGASLAFLVPAVVIALFSWALVRSTAVSLPPYTLERVDMSVFPGP